MKKKEVIFVLILLVFALSRMIVQSFGSQSGGSVMVYHDNKLYGVYSLSEERIIKIDGSNTLEITEGRVRMREADCPDQTCKKQGFIKNKGESIICLPNQVVVALEGTEEEMDGVVN